MMNQHAYAVTLEELKMVQRYIILGYMRDMLDRERKKLDNNPNLLNNLFSGINEAVFDWIHRDLLALKKEFKARQIKVVEGVHSDGVLSHDIWCRGYRKDFPLWREHAKSEIARRFGEYTAEVEKKMRAAR